MTAGDPSDIELWDRAVAGDPEGFGALFERHARSVYNHCFRRTASWADAEELTSAVFLEAWRRRREVRPTGEPARGEVPLPRNVVVVHSPSSAFRGARSSVTPSVSIGGRQFPSMPASRARARDSRERTVPTGMPSTVAASW